jgi:hypothetical protein
MDVEGLHRLIAEEGRGLGYDLERRSMRAQSAYLAIVTQLRHLHGAAALNAITVGDIADYGEDGLGAAAEDIRDRLEIVIGDIEAIVASLKRLANAAADAGDGND